MSELGATPEPDYGGDLAIKQAMADYMQAVRDDGAALRTREEDGFQSADPEYYERIAEVIADLLHADPVAGPLILAQLVRDIEHVGWRNQDRLHETQGMNAEQLEAWSHRHKERLSRTAE